MIIKEYPQHKLRIRELLPLPHVNETKGFVLVRAFYTELKGTKEWYVARKYWPAFYLYRIVGAKNTHSLFYKSILSQNHGPGHFLKYWDYVAPPNEEILKEVTDIYSCIKNRSIDLDKSDTPVSRVTVPVIPRTPVCPIIRVSSVLL